MGVLQDTYTLFLREMLIFRKNLKVNIGRSLVFPIVFILFLGSIGNTPKNTPISVVNYDNGPASIRFINALETGGVLVVTSSTNQQAALALLSQGSVVAVVVIPSGFSSASRPTVYTYLDASYSVGSSEASSVVNSVAATFGRPAVPSGPASGGVTVLSNKVYGASSNNVSFTVAGILIMVGTFGAIFGAGLTMLSDRELGNLKAFLITPINKFSVLFSKVLSGTVQSAFQSYVALGIGVLYGATIAAGILGVFEILWFVFLAGFGFSALAMALAARIKSTQTYALIGQTLALPLSFLAGAFVPVSSLPSFLHPFSVYNPLTYAVNAVRDIMVKGYLPLGTFVVDSAIMLAFAGVMLVVSYLLFRRVNE